MHQFSQIIKTESKIIASTQVHDKKKRHEMQLAKLHSNQSFAQLR